MEGFSPSEECSRVGGCVRQRRLKKKKLKCELPAGQALVLWRRTNIDAGGRTAKHHNIHPPLSVTRGMWKILHRGGGAAVKKVEYGC